MKKRHINEFMKTRFANYGRAAGMGILEDHYDEESGLPHYGGSVRVITPSDFMTPEERAKLSGPVKTYRIPRKEKKCVHTN